jgi:hypothetical protein
MKKSILLMLPFALGLAACSGTSPLSKGNIITPKFMERNFVNTRAPEFVKNEYEVDKKVEIGAYNFEGYVTYAKHADWLVFSDAEGKEAVYSQILNKFVTPFYDGGFGFMYIDLVDAELGGEDIAFLEYAFDDDETGETWTNYVVDELGNEPFTAVSSPSTEYIEVTGRALEDYERSGQEVFVAFLTGYDATLFEPQFAVYNIDGSISRKGTYSEWIEQSGAAASYGYAQTNLADFGHPELALVQSHALGGGVRFSVYNNQESKFVSSFEVPTGASFFPVGDFFLAQEFNALEERATDYDFYDVDTATKYNVTTYKYNYTNGNKETLDTKILFGHPDQLYDEKGVYKYALAEEARVIRDDKTLENTEFAFVLDESLNVVADVTGINFFDLERIDNDHYFDPITNIMYNGSLEEIAYLPNVEEIESNAIVFSTPEGFYGLYSFDGKVLLQAKYTFLFEIEAGMYYCGDEYKAEYFVKVENGAASVVKEFDLDTYTWAGYYDPFYTCVAYAYETEEGTEYVYYNMVTGQEFEAFELADDDTPLYNMGYSYMMGQTRVAYGYLCEHADGSLFLVQYTLAATYAFPTIAE